ncbi:MAG: DUF1493 family protein [Flavobacterium sp.]
MELTIDNLISFIKDDIQEEIFLNENTKIREKLRIDGVVAEDFLIGLENRFNVSFKKFNFLNFFYSEEEINPFVPFWKLLRKRRIRKIEKELTIQDLFHFMENNKK